MSKGLMLVIATAIISGVSIYMNRFGVDVVNPSVFTFLKNSLVFVMLFGILFFAGRVKDFTKLSRKDWITLALIGLVGGSIPFLLFFKGLALTTAAKGSFVHKTMFLYVAVLAYIFLKEKFDWKFFAASGLLLLGNFLLLKVTYQPFNIGDMMILGAAVLWAVENVISKKILARLDSRIVSFSRMSFGSAFILLFLIATGEAPKIMTLTGVQVGWTLFTSVLLLGYLLAWYEGLKTVPVTLATSLLMLGSPITTMLGVFSGNAITGMQLIGIALLCIGNIALLHIFKIIRLPTIVKQ
jgi:drug/metabolite transporter (DMT)-like permease